MARVGARPIAWHSTPWLARSRGSPVRDARRPRSFRICIACMNVARSDASVPGICVKGGDPTSEGRLGTPRGAPGLVSGSDLRQRHEHDLVTLVHARFVRLLQTVAVIGTRPGVMRAGRGQMNLRSVCDADLRPSSLAERSGSCAWRKTRALSKRRRVGACAGGAVSAGGRGHRPRPPAGGASASVTRATPSGGRQRQRQCDAGHAGGRRLVSASASVRAPRRRVPPAPSAAPGARYGGSHPGSGAGVR